jgi:hypothetical protein
MKTIKNILLLGLLVFTVSMASAQEVVKMVNPLGSLAVPIYSDTVTNAGTSYLTVRNMDSRSLSRVTIQVNVTKISGTVGGTISILGSIDGTNYVALNTEETQTALATKTAADATAVYHWRLKGNDFTWYRVSWTGTGTMAASFSGLLLSR